jgi:hypothetical protein
MGRYYCLNQCLQGIQWIGCAVVTIAGLILLTHGCTSFQTITTREIVYDTVVVRVQDTALVVCRGERPSRVIIFSYPGQEETFKVGEVIRIILDGVDLEQSRLEGDFTGSGYVKLRLVNQSDPVQLKSKCQTIRIFQLSIPKIEVLPEIQGQEQVIVTPIYNKQCEHIGYEIRYGSTERGCWQQAKQVLEQFQRCTKGTMLISPPRKPSRYKPLRDLF